MNPCLQGTTDINSLEAGWEFVDEAKIIVYGAVDPAPTIKEKFDELILAVTSLDVKVFKNEFVKKNVFLKKQLRLNIRNAKWFFTSRPEKIRGQSSQE